MAYVTKINGYDIKDSEARSDVSTLQESMTTAQGDIETLQNDLSDTKADLGDITALDTTVKTSLVAAINEVDSHADTNASEIGTLSSLTTTDRTDIVSAINEVKSDVNNEAIARDTAITNAINALDASEVGGSGKYIESVSQTNGVISATEKSFGSIAKSNAFPVPGGSIYLYMQDVLSHKIMRLSPKDISAYYNDGTLWKRLNGTDGYTLFEDIYAGDYFQMSRAITCPNSTDGTSGTSWVTIAEIDGLMYQGYPQWMTAHHLVMVPGKGIDTSEANHFGRHAMNDSNTTTNAYKGSKMFTDVIGTPVSAGSTASGATINQQLYAEFGSHLQTTGELLSAAMDSGATNRFGNAGGASSSWDWTLCQAVLLSEIEVYGSIIWSSSGFDTGTAKKQFAAFKHPLVQNNRTSYYWLKDVASAADFCYVYGRGYARCGDAGDTGCYIRPRFVLAA